MKRASVSVLILFLLISISYGDTVYKWVDKEGVSHFTDDYDRIPPQYRNQVKTEDSGESRSVETPRPSPSIAPERKGEGKEKDNYGQGEEYWRSRVLPWKRKLQEATENYENVKKRISDKTDERSEKYLTPTQASIARAESRQLLEERSKYEDQVREAKEMLQKIAKEAEEAKANPDWVK